jgi:hypothetical protein
MSLPAAWVDQIFGKLALTYGAHFARLWEGLDLDAVKANWAWELAGFASAPQAIQYALDNLPERPPTALVFRAICRLAPEAKAVYLPPPKRDPIRAREVREAFQALREAPKHGKAAYAWAYALQERERAGELLTEAQRKAWRAALADVPLALLAGEFNPPPRDVLPPGMREEAE